MLSLSAVGCGSVAPCTAHNCHHEECMSLAGCEDLPEAGGSVALRANDWGSEESADSGRILTVGGPGDGVVYLAFGPLPKRLDRAILYLRPAGTAVAPNDELRLTAGATDRFFGRALTQRPSERGFATHAVLGPSEPRLVSFDVTAAARASSNQALYLKISQASGSRDVPIRLAGPVAEVPSSRPLLTVWGR